MSSIGSPLSAICNLTKATEEELEEMFLSFELDSGPLTEDGRTLSVNGTNLEWYQLLYLRSRVFGVQSGLIPPLITKLGEGLGTWGDVKTVMSSMRADDLHAELEGCDEITPDDFLAKVPYFRNDPDGSQWELFKQAIKQEDPESRRPVIHLPTLLRFVTGCRAMLCDRTLKPSKREPYRQDIVITVDDNRSLECGIKPWACFYKVFMPRYATLEAMTQGILTWYKVQNFSDA